MANKTGYPTFLKHVHTLNTYLANHLPTMTARLEITTSTTPSTNDLTALQNACSQILANWPTYKELP